MFRFLRSPAGIGAGTAVCLLVSSAGSGAAAHVPSGRTPLAVAGATTRVSVSSTGVEGNKNSGFSAVSAGGRYVAFESLASNLVVGDNTRFNDVFLRDRTSGTTVLVSVSSTGTQANFNSNSATSTADGRYVAFDTAATNLVHGDTNHVRDVFVRDVSAGTTRRVSVGRGGAQADSVSRDPMISPNGRFVVFDSYASNLVRGDTNGKQDVFIRDLKTGTTRLVSAGRGGAPANGPSTRPAISANGHFVTFESTATNVVRANTKHGRDIFVRNLSTGRTHLVTAGRAGAPANGSSDDPTISGGGRYVVFASNASNLVARDTNGRSDVFVFDRHSDKTRRVSVGRRGVEANSECFDPVVSANGRYVAFDSYASNLVANDTNHVSDVFVRDLMTGTMRRISVRPGGAETHQNSFQPSISASGRYVAYDSLSSALVANDTNASFDVFLWDKLG